MSDADGSSAGEMPYRGLRVLEIGSRVAVAACGRMLADLGAEVIVLETDAASCREGSKWEDRPSALAGKQCVGVDFASAQSTSALVSIIERADVVITSSDADPAHFADYGATSIARVPIICDISAFGSSGPLKGRYAHEYELQALTGVLATTGASDEAPTPIGFPVLEMSAGIYAASAIALALHAMQRDGKGQRVEVAIYDVGINSLTTFMPAYFAGRTPKRLGNGHGMAVPWNAYRAADGWVLICSTNDAQWRRIASLIDVSLAENPRFATLTSRLDARAEVDATMTEWTRGLPMADIADALGRQNIPCGTILGLDVVEQEPNLVHRKSVWRCIDPCDRQEKRVAGPLIRIDGQKPTNAPEIPVPRDPHDFLQGECATWFDAVTTDATGVSLPALAGLRVVEIGQLTTAPLAARHLASFGADVIKVEPPGGESARSWAPIRENTSHFFIASNGQKRSLELDLHDPRDMARLEQLLSDADVLVENMKPGSLAKLGLTPTRIASLNPKLIYCSISGFGADAFYAGRPAVDTVIQAMSGMMDATRCQSGAPVKAGISAADIAGGETGLLAIVAALARRRRTGAGSVIDISMQDVGAWMTQRHWNGLHATLAYAGHVASVAEACTHAQTKARELIVVRPDEKGGRWEVFGSPMRLSRTPAQTGTLIGDPGKGEMTWL